MLVRIDASRRRIILERCYRSKDELIRLHSGLKLTACPACKATGTLNLRGCLYG